MLRGVLMPVNLYCIIDLCNLLDFRNRKKLEERQKLLAAQLNGRFVCLGLVLVAFIGLTAGQNGLHL